jgi:Ca2+-binding RTX toxin-like protein
VTTKAGAELSTHDLTLDSSGRVIIAGTVQEPLVTSAALFRFTPAGTLDPAFGSAGVVRTNFSAAFAVGDTPLVDAAGRYLLVGSGSDVSTRVLGFARFLNSSTAVAAPAPTPAPIAPAPPAPKPACGGRTATIVGTAGADHLKGTKKADVIVGLGGNDTIKGLGGNDLICAGAGADKVFGGPGADRILGEGGKDQLFGGPGADALLGGAGADTLVGGPGKDQEVGGPGKDEQR